MNQQEKILFEALSKKRKWLRDALDDPAAGGVWRSVMDKYSDQAHFVYELLQNADDAHATYVRFILKPDQLIFAHNGAKHFSVSDVGTEPEDKKTGKLGDINSITSIGNSSKDAQNTIGKFGVGFKAVFHYTSAPYIYDSDFQFKIERYMIPVLLEKDHSDRRAEETLFMFPFDLPSKPATEAYNDIADKLKNLTFPLLFLSNLQRIEFSFAGVSGQYRKNIQATHLFGDTVAEYVCLTQSIDDETVEESLWMFSRKDDHQRRYSVGFFLDEDGNLRAVQRPAFCFFPTKENTGLNFIVHAPFLLTDSREGIKAGEEHNHNMIHGLAELAADSMLYLRDIGEAEGIRLIEENILDIIPVDRKNFSDPADKSKVSFLPIYEKIQRKFQTEALLPTRDGYTTKNNAYRAATLNLIKLLSDEQLGDICGNKDAHWVFVNRGSTEMQNSNPTLYGYITSLVRTFIDEEAVLEGRSGKRQYDPLTNERRTMEDMPGITEDFIEKQSVEWLHDFYKWILDSTNRQKIVMKKPIFLDDSGKAVAAFDEEGQSILFLPVEGMVGYNVVHPALLQDPDICEFLDKMGVKEPTLKDRIYNIILPMYQRGDTEPDVRKHFQEFFKYYLECLLEGMGTEEFVDMIRDYEILLYRTEEDEALHRGTADSMYYPKPELCAFLSAKKEVRFLALDEYKVLVSNSQMKYLDSFLTELGVNNKLCIEEIPIEDHRTDLPKPMSSREHTCEYTEKEIDGCKELVRYIERNRDSSKSVILWNQLLQIIKEHGKLSGLLSGWCRYYYRKWKVEKFPSSDEKILKSSAWLCSQSGEFAVPNTLDRESLSEQYETSTEEAKSLMDFLGIAERVIPIPEDDSNLTDAQRSKIELADRLAAYGIDKLEDADFEAFLEFQRKQKIKKENAPLGHTQQTSRHGEENEDFDGVLNELEEDSLEQSFNGEASVHAITPTAKEVFRDVGRRMQQGTSRTTAKKTEETPEELDQDDFMPSPIDYTKKVEQEKQKSAEALEKIAREAELQEKALQAEKYSFGWFKVLLDLESAAGDEKNTGNREVSISFAKVEREPGTNRTLVLKHPNRYIPQFMEELADIPLVLHMGEQTKSIAIEVANIKSYTLRVKMKNSADLDGVDLSLVTAATINAQSPVFLLEELKKGFEDLGYDDGFNMKQNLCENIEFVFGPPGTGKTTHLARNVLMPLMQEQRDCKVLVLTPTNKAADVLVNRIMEISGDDTSYEQWLVRFGTPGDERIEGSPVFKDKTFDIRTLSRNVTVTTIARFSYDYFMPYGARLFLRDLNWDYIVIDEASMIPLANIVYPLYKKTPKKFIIAGDPFQIEPITSVALWKNENIYTMVELKSFAHPTTVPHPYKVELLTTQYRSVPAIGQVFSEFSYDGILKHQRSENSRKKLELGGELKIGTLNLLKFPVSKYESIYRAKRLQHSSSYQVYSALFTFEYIRYLSRIIAKYNPGLVFKIGVIAPYRAQADLIEKLIASETFPEEVDVQVGTIHGFQGDECDMIFAVFNTPPTISSSKEMFLNKRNIINVSISRARDYLFVVMPDDETENVENLRLVKDVEGLIKKSEGWTETHTSDLEQLMFGDAAYLENNAFSTSHQSVNVYGLPEKCYEIRTEDNAVDVQIHDSGD